MQRGFEENIGMVRTCHIQQDKIIKYLERKFFKLVMRFHSSKSCKQIKIQRAIFLVYWFESTRSNALRYEFCFIFIQVAKARNEFFLMIQIRRIDVKISKLRVRPTTSFRIKSNVIYMHLKRNHHYHVECLIKLYHFISMSKLQL